MELAAQLTSIHGGNGGWGWAGGKECDGLLSAGFLVQHLGPFFDRRLGRCASHSFPAGPRSPAGPPNGEVPAHQHCQNLHVWVWNSAQVRPLSDGLKQTGRPPLFLEPQPHSASHKLRHLGTLLRGRTNYNKAYGGAAAHFHTREGCF